MKNNIKTILKDMYMIDDSLKKHEKDLIPLIERIIESRPDTKFDKKFAKELRMQLLSNTSSLIAQDKFFKKIINTFKSMANIYKYAGVVGVVVFLAFVGIYTAGQKGINKLAFAPEISKLGSNAFGSLVSQDGKGTDTAQERLGTDQALAESEASMLGSEMTKSARSSIAVPSAGFGGGGGMAVGERMIIPSPIEYNYTYSGEDFELSDSSVSVLRRVKGEVGSSGIVQQIKSMNIGIGDLSSFTNTKIQNLSFYEDKDFGYYVDVNFREGMISIYENWEKWSNPLSRCTDERCYNDNRLTIQDVPSDDELLSIANAFLSDYGINAQLYASPEIIDDWRKVYESTGDESSVWVPDQITIRYPMLVDGEKIYDQGGNIVGLNVNVNVRYKRASGVYNLRVNKFESSEYEAITDVKKIIAYAEQGGMTGPVFYESNGMTNVGENVELGTPEKVMVQIYNYSNGLSNELLVPALRFPILNKSDDATFFWRNSVIVPLAKELIRDAVLPEPRPMPVEDVIIMDSAEPVSPPEGADIIEVNE